MQLFRERNFQFQAAVYRCVLWGSQGRNLYELFTPYPQEREKRNGCFSLMHFWTKGMVPPTVGSVFLHELT